MRIGVISDTHGLLRESAVDAMHGCDLIIHAGDVGKPEIIDALERLAPLKVIKGNIDKKPWAAALPETLRFSLMGHEFFVIHNLKELSFDPASENIHCVISGHSHQPKLFEQSGVLFLNPGSAGPRRFSLPICLATIELRQNVRIAARLVEFSA
ncbi:MAG: metallophosphoesterase family protein [Pseudomonadota bacterium]